MKTTDKNFWRVKKDKLMHLVTLSKRFRLLNVEVKFGLIFDKFVSWSKVVYLLAIIKRGSVDKAGNNKSRTLYWFSPSISLWSSSLQFLLLRFSSSNPFFSESTGASGQCSVYLEFVGISTGIVLRKHNGHKNIMSLNLIWDRELFLRKQISPAFQTTFRRNTPVFRHWSQYFTVHNSVSSYNITFKQCVIQNSLLAFPFVW